MKFIFAELSTSSIPIKTITAFFLVIIPKMPRQNSRELIAKK
jgi:hypothetical protein